MLNLSSMKIDFNCPGCSFKNEVSLKQVKNEDSILCRGCKQSIKLENKDNGLKRLDKSFRDLEKTFKKFGK